MKRKLMVTCFLLIISVTAQAGLFSAFGTKRVQLQMPAQIETSQIKAVSDEDLMSDEIERRQKEIEKIHSKLVEVNGLFNDLNELVQAQGKIIDVITHNIDSAKGHTLKGLVALQEACELQ